MKKILLSSLLSAGTVLCSMAQMSNGYNKAINTHLPAFSVRIGLAFNDDPQFKPTQGTTVTRPSTSPYRAGTYVKIGATKYDLQTNASMGRRIIVHSDGTISAVWTTAPDDQFQQRGSGYNYYNGTSWFSSSNQRIENQRIGWPSIGILPNGQEYVIGHYATSGGFTIAKNTSKGVNTFTTSPFILTQGQNKPIWGRAANNGNIIHLICSYSDSAQVGEKRAPTINGVFAPMTYSRSLDGGATWDIQHILLPGYDSTRILSGGGDVYSIDVRDSIVAIVTGGVGDDVSVFKSTDNGTTFVKIIADSFRYAPYNFRKVTVDTPFTNDGGLDVVIDGNGNVHAFWSMIRIFDNDSTDDRLFFFNGIAAIAHWSEETMTTNIVISGDEFDRNGDATLTITRETTVSASQATDLALNGSGRLGSTGLINTPNVGIDENGNMYMVFSMAVEGDVDINNVNFRDIFIVYSSDNGATWSEPQDITKWAQNEEDFPCIARVVNGFVHVIFQSDYLAGTNLQNNITGTGNHGVNDNEIYYAAIPVSEILNNQIGNNHGLSIEDVNNNAKLFVVSQNTPNPFSGETNVVVYLNTSTDIQVSVTNILGQTVYNEQYQSLPQGNHSIVINSNGWTPGVYFYTFKAGNTVVTKKMIVE